MVRNVCDTDIMCLGFTISSCGALDVIMDSMIWVSLECLDRFPLSLLTMLFRIRDESRTSSLHSSRDASMETSRCEDQ